MKAKITRQHSAAFQKVRILLAIDPTLIRRQCILGYISDVNLYATLSIIPAIPPEFDIIVCSLPVAVNTSRLKWSLSDGHSALSTPVRRQLLDVIKLPIYPSVKPGPFRDVLSVRSKITSCKVIIQAVFRNEFDCGDWLLYVVRYAFPMLQGKA